MAGERRPLHGEAGVVVWNHAGGSVFTCWLPQARLRIRRALAFTGTTLRLSVEVAHDDPQPRDIEWCEHLTMGSPFIDGATCEAGIDAAWQGPFVDARSQFARYAPDAAIPIAEALRIPGPQEPPSGDVLTSRVAEGWWTVANPRLGRRLTARFSRDDFPWIALWTQDRSRRSAPWHGRERTRGMEMSTKPFPEGRPPLHRRGSWHGRPTGCVLPPGMWTRRSIELTWEAIRPS